MKIASSLLSSKPANQSFNSRFQKTLITSVLLTKQTSQPIIKISPSHICSLIFNVKFIVEIVALILKYSSAINTAQVTSLPSSALQGCAVHIKSLFKYSVISAGRNLNLSMFKFVWVTATLKFFKQSCQAKHRVGIENICLSKWEGKVARTTRKAKKTCCRLTATKPWLPRLKNPISPWEKYTENPSHRSKHNGTWQLLRGN